MSDLDWAPERARAMGELGLDLWQRFLDGLRARPVASAHPAEAVRQAVVRDIPELPLPIEEVVAWLERVVVDHGTHPGHPRFLGYITGAGTIPGTVADLVASGANQNAGAWRLAPGVTEVELALTRWFAARIGLPAGSGGILLSGSAMANFTALKVARDARAGWDVRAEGLGGGPQLTIYASTESHTVIERAVDMLGIGAVGLRQLAADRLGRLGVDELEAAIRADRAAGRRPIAVVATAGTVGRGAIDPLAELAELCEREDLWLHVDSAYGAAAAMVDELRSLFSGIERADSIAFDCHKWLYVPVAVGCVLVREPALLAASFATEPAYVVEDRERTGRGQDIRMLGPQFSRSPAALRVWASLLAHGWGAYRRRILHDVELAQWLHSRATDRPDFEAHHRPLLSITCFRYVPAGLADGPRREDALDRLNQALMTELQLDGRAYCSNAMIDGHFWLRACIVNYRTEAADLDILLDVAAELGARLATELTRW